eukprot:Skav233071  [mRNA]  locus=scaffold1468:200815:206654:- [translate_table: standard]
MATSQPPTAATYFVPEVRVANPRISRLQSPGSPLAAHWGPTGHYKKLIPQSLGCTLVSMLFPAPGVPQAPAGLDFDFLLADLSQQDGESTAEGPCAAAAQARGGAEAAGSLGRAPRRHCDITAFHYSTVINACGRAGDWPRAVQLSVARGARAVRPDTIVYNSAISACAGSWPQALQLLEMLTGDRCELSPDTLTFNCLITACSEKWQLGLQLIRQAVHGHATPDAVTYNAAMRGCQGAKEWRWALKLMEEMSEARLAKDQITYTTALSGWEMDGLERQWELALTLLHDLEVNAVQADAQVYTAFVVVCGRASQWQRSLELLRSDVADTAMCNALITACGQGMAPQQWMEWETSLALLAAHRSRADAITLSATVSACCDARQWEAAIAILGAGAELNTAGLGCFNAILGGCEWDVVLALLEEMDRRRVAKDSLSFSTAITACERAEECLGGLAEV